jgi:hypothetical protein
MARILVDIKDVAPTIAALRKLREAIESRIDADIALLDALDAINEECEADYAEILDIAGGEAVFIGRSTDHGMDVSDMPHDVDYLGNFGGAFEGGSGL